jgi:DNA invertase Pin-like site-specific DNA recombinase
MHHIYLRVSTDRQDAAAQRTGVIAWLTQAGITEYTEQQDTGSGAKTWRDRLLLEVLDEAISGDTIVAAEVSRVGRSTIDCLDFFRAASERGVNVIITKSGLRVDGSLASKITTTVLALAAEIEREMLIARTIEGIARAQADGKHCGRPIGRLGISKCEKNRADIAKMLKLKLPHTTIAKLTGCSRHTLRRWLARQTSPA